MLFDRSGSTLAIMDDLQIAVHSYDGCPRGCPGCLVDKDFKNNRRFTPILSRDQLDIINRRVLEYRDWAFENLNTKETGYFRVGGHQVRHHSYTYRFGNHAELTADQLMFLSSSVETGFRVFSSGPPADEDLLKFKRIQDEVGGMVMLEIIYDPFVDSPQHLRERILAMRAAGLNGYPELIVTDRLIREYSPERFVGECVSVYGDIGTQIQFGRYCPSRTRNFNSSQMASLDDEVEWLTAMAKHIVQGGYDIHPIPLGEYAVTLLDDYGEHVARCTDGSIDEARLPPEEGFNAASTREKIRDIFATSLYIDHQLDVYLWSESMGQHVLDGNLGYAPLGNLMTSSLVAIASEDGGALDRMVNATMRDLLSNQRCAPCRYKSFCASHAIPLFRKSFSDTGRHCFGYLPVIREFQRDIGFLQNMIGAFRELGF